ncbi:flagellar hook-length control protein FliK [Bacillus sp. AK031]
MNVGVMLSMQKLGQLSVQGNSLKGGDSKQGTLFSGMLSAVDSAPGKAEPIPEAMLKLLNMMEILQPVETTSLKSEEEVELSMENILDALNISVEELTEAMQLIKESMGNEVPQIKELIAQMSKQEPEEALFQLIELIGLVPADSLKKLDSTGMEVLLKTAKGYEQAFNQSEMDFRQSEKAETLQQNLKALTQKIEQFLTSTKFAGRNWNQILEKAFNNIYLTGDNTSQFNNNSPSLSRLFQNGNRTLNEVEHLQSKETTISNFSSGMFTQQTAKVEQLSLFMNKGENHTTYEQFTKEFAKVIGRSQLLQTPSMSKLLIKLYPEQLGSIRIELLQQDGVMTAKILASTKTAKEMLDSQLNGLRQAFSSHNLQVDKIEVAQTLSESSRQERQSSQQQGGQQQKGQSGQEHRHNDDETEATFKDILMNSEV